MRMFVPVSLSPADGKEERYVVVTKATPEELRHAIVLMQHLGQHAEAEEIAAYYLGKFGPDDDDDDDDEEIQS